MILTGRIQAPDIRFSLEWPPRRCIPKSEVRKSKRDSAIEALDTKLDVRSPSARGTHDRYIGVFRVSMNLGERKAEDGRRTAGWSIAFTREQHWEPLAWAH